MSVKQYQAIIAIIPRGEGEGVINASRKVGAMGGTILHGRGTSIHETRNFLGNLIEPEKDVVLIVVKQSIVDNVMAHVREEMDIDAPGRGIIFVIDVERAEGFLE